MEKQINNKQISKLHVLLSHAGMLEHKRDLIFEVSNRRTVSSKELTYREVTKLIKYLESLCSEVIPATERMKKKVFALAYEAGLIYGESPEDKKMNSAKLNKFLLERGTVKKELNAMTKSELQKTLGQFESIAKHMAESKHTKEVNSLLTELNIKTV